MRNRIVPLSSRFKSRSTITPNPNVIMLIWSRSSFQNFAKKYSAGAHKQTQHAQRYICFSSHARPDTRYDRCTFRTYANCNLAMNNEYGTSPLLIHANAKEEWRSNESSIRVPVISKKKLL